MRVYRSDVVSSRSAEAKPPRSVHRLDEPAGVSLSMVASPQCRLRFARQDYSSAAPTSAATFRLARHTFPIAVLDRVNLSESRLCRLPQAKNLARMKSSPP